MHSIVIINILLVITYCEGKSDLQSKSKKKRSNEKVSYELCFNDERYMIEFQRKVVEVDNFYNKVSDSICMTLKQVKNTGKMLRKTCQPKINVEDAKIDQINNGVFIDEKEVKCYIACIMKMANTLKNGKFDADTAVKQINLLFPDEIKEPAKAAVNACRKVSASYKDNCDASYYTTKCIHDHNPAIFFFP